MTEDWKAESDPLVALGNGDPKPFEDFVIRETPAFLAFFRRLGAQASEAEDLTQDLAFKLYRQAENYRAEGRFRAFAFRVARNLWIDRVRKVGREPRRTQGSSRDDMPSLLYSLPDEHQAEPGAALEKREEAERGEQDGDDQQDLSPRRTPDGLGEAARRLDGIARGGERKGSLWKPQLQLKKSQQPPKWG